MTKHSENTEPSNSTKPVLNDGFKTYLSKIYYQDNNQFDKICVGLIYFDGKTTICKIKDDKMKFVKKLNLKAFDLFEFSALSFVNNILDNGATYDIIERTSRYQNGIFQVTKPSFIAVDCNYDNFNSYFERYV